MGRFYPIDWLCSFIAALRSTQRMDEQIKWFYLNYLQPNAKEILFEVTDHRSWLRHMQESLLVLKADYKELYDELVQESSNVTADVLRTAQLATPDGNYDDDHIFTKKFDLVNYEPIFQRSNYSHVYDSYADFKNPIQWMVEVEYPRFVAWQVFCPDVATGVSFDNYMVVQKYIRNDLYELITKDSRIVDKVIRKDGEAEYAVLTVKPEDVTAVVEDGVVTVSSKQSVQVLNRPSGWSENASTLVVH